MSLDFLLLAASVAALPDTPLDVQIIAESGRFVLRTNDPAKALYTYDRDAPGRSTCSGSCAVAWPPLRVSERARPIGRWKIIARADGARQWTFDGKPIYTNAGDPEARAAGDGAGGVWHQLMTFPAR
jgi:predicted lipoprotein with Yx(FWY)xxD motif